MCMKYLLLCIVMIPSRLSAQTSNDNLQAKADGALTEEESMKWTTAGFRQVNTMGGGEAAIPASGKFRDFLVHG